MAFILRLSTVCFLLALSFSSSAQICDCVTTGNCPVPINDNGTYNGTLDVTVNGANDLGDNPITSVCFAITHTWIGDLSVSLTSPSGVNYMLMADVNNNYGGCGMQQDNVDICIVTGDGNPLTNNTEYMCNAAPCAAGTCCLTGDWTVACGGVTDPINNAQEAPNCDLNDFNIAGQPANGTWTLTVVDVCNMDTGTLDNFSLNFANGVESCIVCSADGGTVDSTVVTSCFGDDDLLFDLQPNYTGSPPDSTYEYCYVTSLNGVVLGVDTIADLTAQPPGNYHVHGLSYLASDTSEISGMIGLDTSTVIAQLLSTTAPFCGDFSSNFAIVNILPTIPVTVVDTLVCEGSCITIDGQQICSTTAVTLNSILGCDSVVQVNITPVQPDTVAFTAMVCEAGCIDVGGNSYCAPGPYFVTLTNILGCDSVINLTFDEVIVAADINPANPGMLTCTNGSITLDGSGSTGNIYSWTSSNGFTSSQASIDVSVPGDYTLVVSDNSVTPACEATLTVTVGDGLVLPDLIVVGASPQICEGDDLDLSTLTIQDQNNTNPVITFHSDTPATPANEITNLIVSPVTSTTYYVLGTNGACTNETSFTLTVNSLPSADFTTSGDICATDDATITFTGSASPSATYTWDFDGATVNPGTGPGPHTVSWPTGGNHTISLMVEENGCSSTFFTQDIAVEEPLAEPQVVCSSTTSSITFTWTDVPGSQNYIVNVINSPGGNPGMDGSDPNTYIFDNLNLNQTATIEVVAVGGGICGNSSAQSTCTVSDCPAVSVVIDPIADICMNNNTMPINLTASATGGVGNGDYIWSGQGVTISGNFNPSLGNIGANTITLDYYEGNCIYAGNTIDINIYETPLVAVNVPFFICSGEPVPVTFTGITDPGSTYTWDFDGGTIVSGSGAGPIDVIWPVGGDYDISLTVESPSGCISETLVQPTTLITPLSNPDITCSSSTSGITFSWPVDPNATSYAVNFPAGLIIQDSSTATTQVYHVINLLPGDIVDIDVEAIGPIACGNAFFQTSCQVEDCPDVVMTIDAVNDICRSSSTNSFNLTAIVTGDTPNGTLEWSGPGVDSNGLFNPNQANLGANAITLTYEESTCIYTETISINIFEQPVADFSSDATACTDEEITVIYTGTNDPNLNYTWDFAGGISASNIGPGPHNVSWPIGGTHTISLVVENQDGCISETATMNVVVEDALQMPIINCSTSTTSIVFTWNAVPGVVDSAITVSTTQAGTLQGNTYTVDGLQPGTSVDFELTLMGMGLCDNVIANASCSTIDCPGITVDIDPVSDICLGVGPSIQLNPTITGSDGSGVGTWSGTGVNPSTGIFDPAIAGTGLHTITYSFEEQSCAFEATTSINVYQQPNASFIADGIVCLTDITTVTFDGIAGNNASFVWNFDGGNATPGVGAGPHEVTWSTPGNKTITLDIENNGCISGQFQQQIQVDESLDIPVISCTSTTESVEFSWTDVPGATGYQVEIIGAGTGPQSQTDATFFVGGLQPGDEVTIQVVPVGNTVCTIQPTSTTCNANLCTDITVEIDPVNPICFHPNAVQETLQATIIGTSGTGTGSWSGPGIIDPVLGIFDPLVAGEGLHTVEYNYQFVNCFYTAEAIVKVAGPPLADAGEDATLSCWESESSVRLGGDNTSTGPNVIFEWSTVTGDLPDNVTILRPEVSEPGTYLLTVTDVELGCSSTDEVIVSSIVDLPEATVSFAPSDCSGQNTTVAINSITGGMEPYLFSLNGNPYVAEDTFAFLSPGDYTLSVIDAAGCESESDFVIDQSGSSLDLELTANLVGRNAIEEGESIQLIALSNLSIDQLDSIVWSNEAYLSCTDCFEPMATPLEETTFTVTIYLNGCEITDEITIYVEYNNPVYVPNAFSPNGDNVNDLFQVYAGDRVVKVNSFMVFDRWGEMVYSQQDFVPNEPVMGWDGTLDGTNMNPGVFAWFTEVELLDGSTEFFEGEVTLIR